MEVDLIQIHPSPPRRLIVHNSPTTTTSSCSYGIDQRLHPPHNRSHSQVKTENATPLLSTSYPSRYLPFCQLLDTLCYGNFTAQTISTFISSSAAAPPLFSIVLRNTFHVDFLYVVPEGIRVDSPCADVGAEAIEHTPVFDVPIPSSFQSANFALILKGSSRSRFPGWTQPPVVMP